MAGLWFLAGVITTLAAVLALLPWLGGFARLRALATRSRPRSAGAAAFAIAVLVSSHWMTRTAAPAGDSGAAASFGEAAKVFDQSTGAASLAGTPAGATAAMPAEQAAAGSMDSAIANLEARLAKGGGNAGDWELLAKAFEFEGRPDDAAKARAHELPRWPPAVPAPGPAAASSAGTVVSGEIDIAAALARRARPGETLFVFATSVDSPGPPVAVYRTTVGAWPMRFRLDDSQSMVPGRNLSTAGRVRIEARVSRDGQPMPSAGDLQGSTAAIDPGAHQPLKIVIDRVVS